MDGVVGMAWNNNSVPNSNTVVTGFMPIVPDSVSEKLRGPRLRTKIAQNFHKFKIWPLQHPK